MNSVFNLKPDSGYPDSIDQKLNTFARQVSAYKKRSIGYPINQDLGLTEFYSWYGQSGLTELALNNAGSPHQASIAPLNTHVFENEVIDFLAPLYGFQADNTWGVITLSGTQGNNLGIYFGTQLLIKQTGLKPVLYVSAEAHYSIKQLAELQQLETRVIKTLVNGRMDINDFERQLLSNRPALIIIAIGTTFKGAIDDQNAIQQVLDSKNNLAVYRHLDAALFGGFLPFSPYAHLLDQNQQWFDSIAVSRHKFFGIDEPAGIFITTKNIQSEQNQPRVPYLNQKIATLACSRSALAALKLWWKIQKTGFPSYQHQAQQLLDNAHYLKTGLEASHYPAWLNPCSNTVYFKRPSQWIMEKWLLVPDDDLRLGGLLAHCVVMQHVSIEIIDEFLTDIGLDSLNNRQVQNTKQHDSVSPSLIDL